MRKMLSTPILYTAESHYTRFPQRKHVNKNPILRNFSELQKVSVTEASSQTGKVTCENSRFNGCVTKLESGKDAWLLLPVQ